MRTLSDSVSWSRSSKLEPPAEHRERTVKKIRRTSGPDAISSPENVRFFTGVQRVTIGFPIWVRSVKFLDLLVSPIWVRCARFLDLGSFCQRAADRSFFKEVKSP